MRASSTLGLMKLVAVAAAGSAAAMPFARAASTGAGSPWAALAFAGIASPLAMAVILPLLFPRGGRRDSAILGLLLISVTVALVLFLGISVLIAREWWRRGGPVPYEPWEVFPISMVALLLPAWIFIAVRLERRLHRNHIATAPPQSGGDP